MHIRQSTARATAGLRPFERLLRHTSVYTVFAAAFGLLGAFVIGLILLPLTASAIAYGVVEARYRRAWTALALPALRIGGGPYRGGELVQGRLRRAPLLVRAAGLGCFYWSWVCLAGWIGIGLKFSERGELVAVAVAGTLVAVATWRAGVHLLRRTPHAVRFGRRVAATVALHAALVLGLATALGDASWSGPAGAFAALSLALAWLVVAATRQHAALFAAGHGQRLDSRVLPAWLAHVLSKRHAQRRANLLVSASQTMPGA
jgi:hypothetical protein